MVYIIAHVVMLLTTLSVLTVYALTVFTFLTTLSVELQVHKPNIQTFTHVQHGSPVS